MGHSFLHLKVTPSHLELWTPSNTWFLGPTQIHNPKGISIGSAIFAGLSIVTAKRPSYSACNNRSYVVLQCSLVICWQCVCWRFLKILQVIVLEPNASFKTFLPTVLNICLCHIYPVLAQVTCMFCLTFSKSTVTERPVLRSKGQSHMVDILYATWAHKSLTVVYDWCWCAVG